MPRRTGCRGSYAADEDLLAEYRASLISHAVTGKIDVRGLVDLEAQPPALLDTPAGATLAASLPHTPA
jgi:hypothetical protein